MVFSAYDLQQFSKLQMLSVTGEVFLVFINKNAIFILLN